jgi:hypothetical protein
MGDVPYIQALQLGAVSARGFGCISSIPVEVNAMLVVITFDVNTEDAAGRRRLRQIA